MAADAELFERNMASLKRHFKKIYDDLRDFKPQSTLVTLPDGSHNIEFRGESLYQNGDRAALEGNLLDLDACSYSLVLAVKLGHTGERFVDSYGRRALKRLEDMNIVLNADADNPQRWFESLHLVFFGAGLGTHLQPIFEARKARSLIVIEPNLDFLWHSMWVTDWGMFFDMRDRDPLSFTLVVTSDPADMALSARAHCRLCAPIAVDGIRVVRHYRSNSFDTAIATLLRDGHLINIGLGFMEDEMEMVRASYHNFRNGDFHLYTHGRKPLFYPAFVVGSGPSLDDDIEFLKENAHRAVVISCGSTLGVLLKNGIKPDFQMQLENSEAPYRMLKNIADSYDISGISLIASTTVSPNIRSLFDHVVFFVRPSLSSHAMFFMGSKHEIPDAGPTVTNTGLSMALTTGFREVYLFGCDMGARNPHQHHSVHAPYAMNGTEADYAKGSELEFEQNFEGQTSTANFGGIVYTDQIMQWSRDTQERLIRLFRASTVYNCSDGISIKGTTPQISYGIDLQSDPEAKAGILEDIRKNWPVIDSASELEKWADKGWRKLVHDKLDAIQQVVDAPLRNDHSDLFDLVMTACRLMLPDAFRSVRFEEYFLRGSVLLTINVYDYALKRIPQDDAHIPARTALREELSESIRELRRNVDWYFDHLNEIEDQDALKRGLEEFANVH